MSFTIRDFDPLRDEAAALSFIDGSQLYEVALEPNRRVDGTVAKDHFGYMMDRVARNGGRIFVAETDGRAIGWAVMSLEENAIFVTADERPHGYIAELFVEEAARGLGVGRALIAACEDETLRRGLRQVKIGVLIANRRSADIYQKAGYAPYSLEWRKYL